MYTGLVTTTERTPFFWSDLHFGHARLLELGFRTGYDSIEEHDELLVERWNNTLTKGDSGYILGDVSFRNKPDTLALLNRMVGRKFFVFGNHDHTLKALWKAQLQKPSSAIEQAYDYKEITVNDQRICLMHFPILSFHQQHRGSWMLHGHCVDLATEVLTSNGWVGRDGVSKGTSIATWNTSSGECEFQQINEVIDVQWSGDVHEVATKSYDGRFTPDHTMVGISANGDVTKFLAKDFGSVSNRTLPSAGVSPNVDYPIDDNMLRLYVWAVTDGNRENSSLLRFHFRKERKILRLTKLLAEMGLAYTENVQASGTTKINLTLPEELSQYSIKPLDDFVRNLSQRQADILVDEYCVTDGTRYGEHSFQLSTAKKEEADLLQALLVTHGYRCSLFVKEHMLLGVMRTSYILWGNSRKQAMTTKSSTLMKVTQTENEHFWCVKVPNQTFIMRRNGKVHVTGNCHGNLTDDLNVRRTDVGVDNYPNGPVSFEEIQELFKDRSGVSSDYVDHHTPQGDRAAFDL